MKFILNFLVVISILIVNESCQQTVAENRDTRISIEPQNKNNATVEIIEKYDLPTELNEISGLVWIRENTFACIQDEEGVIYIYDIEKSEIINRIKFSDNGDYEGLCVNGNTAYVQRSDGEIFIVKDFLGSNTTTKQYKTDLTAKQNIEGITFDKNNHRLLSVVKDKEPGKVDYKGVYAFDLHTFKMIKEPVFKIPASDKRYKNAGLKKSTFYPSGISIYEPSKHIFIVDGRQAGLLEIDKNGAVNNIYDLGTSNFSQAESITFDNEGHIFISSEAGKGKAHISLVKLSQ